MRRFLSWVVLWISGAIIAVIGQIVIQLLFILLDWIDSMSRAVYIFLLFMFGGIGFFILLLPFIIGIPLIIKCSETVCPSKKGTRYLIYFIITIVGAVYPIIINGLSFAHIYNLIFGIVGLIVYKHHLGETFD